MKDNERTRPAVLDAAVELLEEHPAGLTCSAISEALRDRGVQVRMFPSNHTLGAWLRIDHRFYSSLQRDRYVWRLN